jgi:hypothetical protein
VGDPVMEEKMEPVATLPGAGRRTLYKTGRGWDREIRAIQVISETAAFVTIENDWAGIKSQVREKRVTDWHRYHETEEAALEFLIVRASREVEKLKRETHQANSFLGELLSRKRKMQPIDAPQAAPAAPPKEGSHD